MPAASSSPGGLLAGSARSAWPTARTWVQFSATPGTTDPGFVGSLVDGGLWRYDVEQVRTIKGRAPTAISAGWRIMRAESRAAMRRPSCELCLEGVTGSLAYTTAAEQEHLPPPVDTRAAPLAVLVLVKKSEAWWRLAADERRAMFAGASADAGHLADATLPLHRLYHARHVPESEWDFLVLYELEEAQIDAWEALLARMRDRSRSEWAFVEREAELWLRRRVR